jgi:hypothetical protein
MGRSLFRRKTRRKRHRAPRGRPDLTFLAPTLSARLRSSGFGKTEIGLPSADQLKIDLRQKLAVQKGAVLFACRIVDPEAAAERIERGGRAGKLPAGNQPQYPDARSLAIVC